MKMKLWTVLTFPLALGVVLGYFSWRLLTAVLDAWGDWRAGRPLRVRMVAPWWLS